MSDASEVEPGEALEVVEIGRSRGAATPRPTVTWAMRVGLVVGALLLAADTVAVGFVLRDGRTIRRELDESQAVLLAAEGYLRQVDEQADQLIK